MSIRWPVACLTHGVYTRADLLAALEHEGYQVKIIHNLKDHYTAEIRKWKDVEQDPETPYQPKMFRKDRLPDILKR